MTDFNVLEQAKLNRRLATNSDRIKRLESFLKGQLLGTVRFNDASITNAKVGSLGADKLTTGQLAVGTNFDIGDSDGGDYIRKSGIDSRILMYRSGVPQLVIGMQTIRVSLPGYNALTDADPDHYALYSDEDWVLIKEKARGSAALGYGEDTNVPHNLGYFPFVLAWGEDADGNYILCTPRSSFELYNMWLMFIYDDEVVFLQGVDDGDKTVKYYIFYDRID
jgi:hypothetical protein